MTFLKVNFETEASTIESFDQIANKIANDINIKINETYYRIVDFEFYVFSKAIPDPHTYKNDLQLQSGKLYLHSSGIDITFGDGENYGGILLRSVVKLYDGADQSSGFMKCQYEGPQIVATELFSSLNSLFDSKKNEISLVDINGYNQDACFYPAIRVLKTKRVGLTPKANDKDDYYRNMPLRYITILPKFPNFQQKIKGIEGILGEQVLNGKLTLKEAHDILGYQKVF